MKKTQNIELFMNIKKTIVSFVSIALFISLAAAMFLGIGWSTTAFENTISYTYELGNMQDAEVFFAYGLSDSEIDDIKTIDDVDKAEGNYSASGYFSMDGTKYQANIRSLSSEINTPTKIEGTLPKKAGEIALDLYWASANNFEIGDTIVITEESNAENLKTNVLKVTALIYVPNYLSQYKVTYGTSSKTGVPFDCIIFADKSSFNTENFAGYTSISVTSNSLKNYNCFSDEYEELDNEFVEKIKEVLKNPIIKITSKLPSSYPKLEASVQGRKANASMGATTVPNEIMSKIKYTLAFLFVLVGVLVCYSAISRIVFEQTVLIGTKKALGLSKKQITASYLLYAVVAVILGSIVGDLLARFVIEPIILKTLADNYNIAKAVYYFSWKDALIFFAVELALILLFSFVACRRVLSKKAVDLLREENDSFGKKRFYEKWKSWSKLSLLSKTIINNFFNDKRRVFATLVGVIGSCALLVSAMTMLSNAYETRDFFNAEIAKYDTILYVDTTVENAAKNISAFLDDEGISSAPVFLSSMYLKIDDGYLGAQFIAFDDDRFYEQFCVLNDGEEVKLGDGIYMCKAYSSFCELEPNEEVEIIDNTGTTRMLSISAPFDYYLMRDLVIMNAKTYEETFDTDYVANTLLLKRDDLSIGELTAMLDGKEGFLSLYDADLEEYNVFQSVISAIYIIAITFAISAVLMAFVVLLNLMIMFVNEKKRELIVMMINGFSRKQVKRYIYTDTIFLSVIGTILGAALGVAVGFITLRLFSSECVIMFTHFNLPVCLCCMLATGVLTFISCLIALKRVENFKLKDINEM